MTKQNLMDLEKIKDLARMSANKQEFETKKDEWHSHYYGYILGFQEGQKQSEPSKLQELMEFYKDMYNIQKEAADLAIKAGGKLEDRVKRLKEVVDFLLPKVKLWIMLDLQSKGKNYLQSAKQADKEHDRLVSLLSDQSQEGGITHD